MKLVYNKSILNEASGTLLNAASKLNKKLDTLFNANKHYNLISKPEGFFITNSSKSLGTINLKFDFDNDIISTQVLAANNYNTIPGFEFSNSGNSIKISEADQKLAQLLDKCLSRIKGQLLKKEELVEFADPKLGGTRNPFKALGNIIKQKIAQNLENSDNKQILNQFKDAIKTQINNDEVFKNCKTDISISNNEIEIDFNFAYVLGVQYGLDPTSKKLIINGILNAAYPEGVSCKLSNIDKFLDLINNKLGVAIGIGKLFNTNTIQEPNVEDDANNNAEEAENTVVTEPKSDEVSNGRDETADKGNEASTTDPRKDFINYKQQIRKGQGDQVTFNDFLKAMQAAETNTKNQARIMKAITDLYSTVYNHPRKNTK